MTAARTADEPAAGADRDGGVLCLRSSLVRAPPRPLNGIALFVGDPLVPWPIPEGFEQLVRDHIHRTRGEDRNHLSAYDFPPGQAVRLAFPDGSFAYFECAFFIEDPPRRLVGVFTEHCGYHVFSSIELTIVTLRATRYGGTADE